MYQQVYFEDIVILSAKFFDIFSVGVWRPESGFHCGMFCCEFLYFWHYKDYKDKMAAIRRLG